MTVARLWRLWALVMAALGLAWLAWHDVAVPSDTDALVRPASRMPELPPAPVLQDPAPALDALARSTLWGPLKPAPGAAAAAAAAPPPGWQVTGYFESGGTRHVVVSYDNQARPSVQLKVGDKLPDGATILHIEPGKLRVRPPRPAAPPEGAASGPAANAAGWIAINAGLPLPER